MFKILISGGIGLSSFNTPHSLKRKSGSGSTPLSSYDSWFSLGVF